LLGNPQDKVESHDRRAYVQDETVKTNCDYVPDETSVHEDDEEALKEAYE